MVFSFFSVYFWAVFIVFIIGYALLKVRSRNAMMIYVLMFNLAVAWATNKWAMLALPLTAVATWFLTRWMDSLLGTKRKGALALTIVLTLAPLVYFKYAGFLVGTWASITGADFSIGKLILPIGISFYTFQAISYSVDVYRGKFTLKADLLEYLFYLTYFPLLMCGPITRADVLIGQLRDNKPATQSQIDTGLFLVICGVLKKAVLADYLALYNNMVFDDPGAFSGFEVALAVVGYAFQIYLDFSGYSDMALGLSSILGITLPDNFNFPYKSMNVTDFWRRWHIALSSWFKDYLYIPLGGNRCSLPRTYFNNMVVMLVSGLWHGASWMFVIWGGLHGIALIIHKACKKLFLDKIPDTWPVRVFCWLIMAAFILASWVFFRSPDMGTAKLVFSQVFTDFSLAYFLPFFNARMMWSIVLCVCLAFSLLKDSHYEWIKKTFVGAHWSLKLLVFAAVVIIVMVFGQSSVQPMIYAQF